jgi:hypothetical protein
MPRVPTVKPDPVVQAAMAAARIKAAELALAKAPRKTPRKRAAA